MAGAAAGVVERRCGVGSERPAVAGLLKSQLQDAQDPRLAYLTVARRWPQPGEVGTPGPDDDLGDAAGDVELPGRVLRREALVGVRAPTRTRSTPWSCIVLTKSPSCEACFSLKLHRGSCINTTVHAVVLLADSRSFSSHTFCADRRPHPSPAGSLPQLTFKATTCQLPMSKL